MTEWYFTKPQIWKWWSLLLSFELPVAHLLVQNVDSQCLESLGYIHLYCLLLSVMWTWWGWGSGVEGFGRRHVALLGKYRYWISCCGWAWTLPILITPCMTSYWDVSSAGQVASSSRMLNIYIWCRKYIKSAAQLKMKI